MPKKFDIVVTETYQGRDGEQKRYKNIGVVLEKDGKMFMKLDMIPTGGWDGFASFYEPRPRSNGGQQQQQPASGGGNNFDDFDDDIPF